MTTLQTVEDRALIDVLRKRARRFERIAEMLETALSSGDSAARMLAEARARGSELGKDVDAIFPGSAEELIDDLRRTARALAGTLIADHEQG